MDIDLNMPRTDREAYLASVRDDGGLIEIWDAVTRAVDIVLNDSNNELECVSEKMQRSKRAMDAASTIADKVSALKEYKSRVKAWVDKVEAFMYMRALIGSVVDEWYEDIARSLTHENL